MRGVTTGLIAAGLLATAISTAQAAPPPFCRGYANAALNQVRVALAIPLYLLHRRLTAHEMMLARA